MKIKFISQSDLDSIKENLKHYTKYFKNESTDWLADVLDHSPFSDSKFTMPDITLDMSEPANKAYLTDAANAQEIYSKLKFLSDSQASDERLWAGLCLGHFYDYVKYRWRIDGNSKEEDIVAHFFFGFGARRSLSRNAVARLWWIGRLTYDENRSDPFELTKFVCENADNTHHILERNTSNNPVIIRAFVDALLEARKEGYNINTDRVGDLSKYLNLLGGTYILDCLPRDTIYNKVLNKAKEISTKIN